MRKFLCIAAALLIAALNSAWGQPALDGHATGTATSGTTTTISVTTTANPEILIVVGAVRATGTTNPNLTISGCSLSWTQLNNQLQFNNAVPKGTAVNQWYAQSASNLSCTITVTSDQTIQNSSAAYCSFSGINTTNAFDPNASVTPPGTAKTNTTNSSTSAQVSLSTSLAHSTMVTTLGQTSANMGGIAAAPAGASLCANVTNSGGLNFSNAFITYETFTATQSGVSIGVNANEPYYNLVGTAVTADAPAGHSRLIQ